MYKLVLLGILTCATAYATYGIHQHTVYMYKVGQFSENGIVGVFSFKDESLPIFNCEYIAKLVNEDVHERLVICLTTKF